MRQSNRLWAVTVKDETERNRSTGFSNLWIIAADTEVASRKARRWLKQQDMHGFSIKSVESHGTIDVF